MELQAMPKIFHHRFTVPESAIDANGHVNNVVYVQWMQDAATLHSDAVGCTRTVYESLGGIWVVRSHFIEYLSPAFAGDQVEVVTWVANMKRSTSLRRYKFLRAADRTVLARAETDWVYVSLDRGRPGTVHPQVRHSFQEVQPQEEP